MRAPQEHDAPAVARLLSEYSPGPTTEDIVRRDWSAPGFEPELDARLDDSSYVAVETFGDGRVWIDVRGRPSPEMIDWGETRAGEKGQRLLSGGWESNSALLRELERRGFEPIRRSYRMRIDLNRPAVEPMWPQGVDVRTFLPGDEHVFHETQQETFRDSWEPIEESFDEWAHWALEPRVLVPDLWFLAVEGTEPAGIAICNRHPGAPELGRVQVLGVRRPWRKRGVGRALLLHAFTAFRRRGLTGAILGVDAESLTGAHRLYEQVGMHVAAQFVIYEKAAA